jgi:hypothetical protein
MRKYVINSRGRVHGSWLPAYANRLSLRAKVKGPNRVENGPLEWPCWAQQRTCVFNLPSLGPYYLRSHLGLGGHRRRPEDSRVGVVLAGGDLGRPPLLAL